MSGASGFFSDPDQWRWRFAPRVALWPGRTFPPKLTYLRVAPGAAPFMDAVACQTGGETLLSFWLGADGVTDEDVA